MSLQAPSPATSAGDGGSPPPVATSSPPASSPSNNGSVPGALSPPPATQPSPSPPTAAASPPVSTPPASSPPPTSSPLPSISRSPPPSSPPPTSSPPPSISRSPPPSSSNSTLPPTASSPPKAAPPARSPPPSVVSSPPPVASSPPPLSTPVNPSSPSAATPPRHSTSSPPLPAPPPSHSSTPSPPLSSSPPTKTPSPKGSPPSPKAPTPTITGGSSPPPGKATSGSPSAPPPIESLPGNTSNATPPLKSPSPTSSTTHSGGSPPQSSKSDGSGGGGLSGVAIGGIAVAGLIVLAVIGVLIWCTKKKRRRDDYSVDYHGQPPGRSFSVKSDGLYASNSPGPYQYSGKTSPPNRGHGYGNGYHAPNGSSGEVAVGVPLQPKANPGLGNSKSWFTYEELAVATDGFSTENLIGEGGFGCVYKGYLPDGQVVAVKQLKVGSGQGEREFQAEVEIISRVHHRHLVSLVGYCIAESQRLLVYDYVPNGTLEHHLHGRGRPVMDWATRLRIAVGAARGLAYLHEDCHPRIIHRDIKSSNILLDDKFEAQVSDFGLAKLALDTNTHVTTRVMGTFGYMAPEYASSGKLTERSDVFSFGVVLLELLTGRKPVDPSQPLGDESLVEWARPSLARALEEGNFEVLADPKLENNFDVNEMFRMVEAAAACVRHSAHRRPRMAQVVRALESNSAIPDLNNGVKPGQSTLYNSAQYSADIRRFRRMAFGSQEYGSDYSGFTTEYEFNPSTSSSEFHNSKEREVKHMRYGKTELETRSTSGSDYPSSGESETCALNRSNIYRDKTRRKSSTEAPITFRDDPVAGS